MRITIRTTILLLFLAVNLTAQDETPPDRLQYHISLGQYPASLGVPSFSALHPGANAGVTIRYTDHIRHQLNQSANLGYFYHKNLQQAIQLFTEVNYTMKFGNGFAITPLSVGGGYVLAIPDMATLEWNAATQQYEEVVRPRSNWLISLGASASWETNFILIKNRKTTFFVDYRLQVQGVFVQETIPVIAYTPVRVGLSFPFKENIRGYMYQNSFFD